ncbi:uncharacterized protein PG998_006866 [Apiospora kogelbergensis]|uniref:uncharacterized protein n=1 Tax=Apiospora kogelbergensis TaxID=1337665 RepID=UPI0031325243
MQRILVSFEVELDCIDHRFLELDHADEHNGILRTLPFDRHKFLARCCGGETDQKQKQQSNAPIQQSLNGATEQPSRPRTAPERQIQQRPQNQRAQLTTAPIQQSRNLVSTTNNHTSRNTGQREERAHLMDSARAIFKEYHHFIGMNKDFQSMQRVSRTQHLVHYLAIIKDQLPSKAAHQYLWARDDFVNTDRNTVHRWFESALYITGPLVQRALCVLLPYFYKREKVRRRSTGKFEYRIRARRLELLQEIVIAFASAVMLLIPVGLMHFYADGCDRDRGKRVSFLITCLSTVIFLAVIISLETNYGRALVGVCAFVAVMASFLANLSGNGAGC